MKKAIYFKNIGLNHWAVRQQTNTYQYYPSLKCPKLLIVLPMMENRWYMDAQQEKILRGMIDVLKLTSKDISILRIKNLASWQHLKAWLEPKYILYFQIDRDATINWQHHYIYTVHHPIILSHKVILKKLAYKKLLHLAKIFNEK